VIYGSKLALERFLPRRRGHLVNIASAAGKWGIAGGATYCATKHAVVGLSEAIAQEVKGTGIDLSIVMPTVVNTELGSGLPQTRAFKPVQPEDVADAIVEALKTGRFDVYVPKSIGATVRMGNLMPRRAWAAISHLLKGDQVLAKPDHVKRAAYEARIAQTVGGSPATGAPERSVAAPLEPAPLEPAPLEPAPLEPAPLESTSLESAPPEPQAGEPTEAGSVS
jgi:NAD(P)-dependent dehydrogenase (short-subunit alcohol dehydrogenase family)